MTYAAVGSAGMGLMYYDWTYILIMIPCLILSLICSASVKSNFSKYSAVKNSRGLTGAQAAQQVLSAHGVTGVRIEPVGGNLTDHFDPRTNVIRLSESVYNAKTVSAVGVACHEAGHAVQHAEGYVPNKIRSAIVPVANIGSKLSWILLVIGMLLPGQFNSWDSITEASQKAQPVLDTLKTRMASSRRRSAAAPGGTSPAPPAVFW